MPKVRNWQDYLPQPDQQPSQSWIVPRLRFQPGWFIEFGGKLYRIICAYRIERNPHIWWFVLEERDNLEQTVDDTYDEDCYPLRRVEQTPFETSFDAERWTREFPHDVARRRFVSNQNLMKGNARVVSSGNVLPSQRLATIEN